MSDLICAMVFIYTMSLTGTVQSFDFDIQLISFDAEMINKRDQIHESKRNLNSERNHTKHKKEENKEASNKHIQRKASKKHITKKASQEHHQEMLRTAECRYQYPERNQVKVILANMINELNMVFVNSNEWLKEMVTKKSNRIVKADDIRRAMDAKFNITHQTRAAFLQGVYHHMVNEYVKFQNSLTEHAQRAGNICKNDDEVKELWQDLLDRCLVALKQGVHRCIGDYLIDHDIKRDSALGIHVQSHLLTAMGKMQFDLLRPLCDQFGMCYDEKLKEFRNTTAKF